MDHDGEGTPVVQVMAGCRGSVVEVVHIKVDPGADVKGESVQG